LKLRPHQLPLLLLLPTPLRLQLLPQQPPPLTQLPLLLQPRPLLLLKKRSSNSLLWYCHNFGCGRQEKKPAQAGFFVV
jgi:hypothetical protein